MQVLQALAAYAGCLLAVCVLLAVRPTGRVRARLPYRASVRPPTRLGRHDARRPRLGLRPVPGSPRAELGLEADRHPGWSLTGAEGLEPGRLAEQPLVQGQPEQGHQRRNEHEQR